MLLRSRRAIALASRVAARRERTVAGASIAAGSRPPTLARGASTEPAPERFEVKVYTANRRGASTLADVGLELVGRGNAAASIHTGPSTEFERASVSKMTVRTADVGDLDRLVVRHALSATDPPSPWLLERVVVKRSSDGRRWNFPCGFWFDTAPGTTSTRTLFAASHAEQRTQVEAALLSGQPLARPLRLLVATASRPHPQKEEEGEEGEDASFSTSIMLGAGDEGDSAGVRPRRLFCVGVADGVAEWALRGVDAGVYARRLTSLARTAFENGHTDPVEVMTAAWSGVRHDGVQGSSTLCIVTVDAETGQLDAANLGDSGFLVARGGKVLFRSPELEHSFGHPYQVCVFRSGQDGLNGCTCV